MTEQTTRYTVRGAIACTAHTTAGKPCEAPAVTGMTICQAHGGSSPQAKQAARLRLAALADPAIDVLAHEMLNAGDANVRISAANSILDRAGYGRNVQITQEDARDLLVAKLMETRDNELEA